MSKHYVSFLLRLWQADSPDNPGWLASLEDPHTRQVITFKNVEALWKFVKSLMTNGIEKDELKGGP